MKKHVFVFSLTSLVCVAGLTLLGSCLKSSDNNNSNLQSMISVLQASPGSSPMDLYFNTDKITANGPLPYAAGGPMTRKAGNYTISFVDNATGDTLVQEQDSISSGLYYSLIVYDTASALKTMFFADQFDQAQDASKAFIRFLQLSPGPDAVNVTMNTSQDTSDMYLQRTFADNVMDPARSKFNTLSQGTYSFTALDAATGDTLGSLEDISLSAGGAYTLFLRGLPGHTQDTLGTKLDIMLNYY